MPSHILNRSRYDREATLRFADMKRRFNRILKEAQQTGFNDDGLRIELA